MIEQKSIIINELTWSKLLSLKIRLKISTFNGMVEKLLEDYDKNESKADLH